MVSSYSIECSKSTSTSQLFKRTFARLLTVQVFDAESGITLYTSEELQVPTTLVPQVIEQSSSYTSTYLTNCLNFDIYGKNGFKL